MYFYFYIYIHICIYDIYMYVLFYIYLFRYVFKIEWLVLWQTHTFGSNSEQTSWSLDLRASQEKNEAGMYEKIGWRFRK